MISHDTQSFSNEDIAIQRSEAEMTVPEMGDIRTPSVLSRLKATTEEHRYATSEHGEVLEQFTQLEIAHHNTNETEENVDFKKERPERAGETESQQGSYSTRKDSREEDQFIDEEPENSEEVSPPTDTFGFFSSPEQVDNNRPTIDLPTLHRREKKWIHMIENWTHFMDHDFDTVRSRCRKGVPPSLRGRVWMHLSGAFYQMHVSPDNRFVYDLLRRQQGDPKHVDEITRDLNRQFPEHELFSHSGRFSENGKEDLFEILKCWTCLYPDEGYCQAQAPVASVLLMNLPVKDAFYCFVQVCRKYLPGYYSPGLENLQIDAEVLSELLHKQNRSLAYYLKVNNVDPMLYMVEWFMCVYCRSFPWPIVLRIWDMFFCEGVKVLFKVALVVLDALLGTRKKCKQYSDMYAIITVLKHIPKTITNNKHFLKKIIEMEIDDVKLEELHLRILKLRQLRKQTTNDQARVFTST